MVLINRVTIVYYLEKAIPFDVVVDQQKKDKADVDRAVYYMKKLRELDNQ